MERQTIRHVISIALALPLLVLALLRVTDEPHLLNPWNKKLLGGLWILVWPMLLAGTLIPLNAVLSLLAGRRRRSSTVPRGNVAPEPARTAQGHPATSASTRWREESAAICPLAQSCGHTTFGV
jgi:hypothetical protein